MTTAPKTLRHARRARSIAVFNYRDAGLTLGGVHRRLHRSVKDLTKPLTDGLKTIATEGGNNKDVADFLGGVAVGLMGEAKDSEVKEGQKGARKEN